MPGTCWDPMDCNEGNPLNEGEMPSVSQPRARAVLGSIPAPSPGRQVPDTGTSPSAPSPQRVPAVTPCHLLGSQAGPQVPRAPPGPCPTQGLYQLPTSASEQPRAVPDSWKRERCPHLLEHTLELPVGPKVCQEESSSFGRFWTGAGKMKATGGLWQAQSSTPQTLLTAWTNPAPAGSLGSHERDCQ